MGTNKKILKEENYKDNPEVAEALKDGYLAIAEGLFLLGNLYRNAHLNHDGNTLVDAFFETWMGDTIGASFELLHRVRIMNPENKIHPFFGLKTLDFVSPIQDIIKSYTNNDENSTLCSDAWTIVDFLSTIESEFQYMCLELNDSLLAKYDPSGANVIATLIEKSEFRLLDMDGIMKGIEQ